MHRSLPFCLGPLLPNWYGSNKAVPDRGFSLWTMHTRPWEDVKTLEARPQGKCLLSQEATAEQAHTVRMAPCLCITPTHPGPSLPTVYPVAAFISKRALPLLGSFYLCLVFASIGWVPSLTPSLPRHPTPSDCLLI